MTTPNPENTSPKPKTEGMTYYAMCVDGHSLFTGPDHDSYDDAERDAREHDRTVHGGTRHAEVSNNV